MSSKEKEESKICDRELGWFDEEKMQTAVCGRDWNKCHHNPKVAEEYARKFRISSWESGIAAQSNAGSATQTTPIV